jgi:hypothetical protein
VLGTRIVLEKLYPSVSVSRKHIPNVLSQVFCNLYQMFFLALSTLTRLGSDGNTTTSFWGLPGARVIDATSTLAFATSSFCSGKLQTVTFRLMSRICDHWDCLTRPQGLLLCAAQILRQREPMQNWETRINIREEMEANKYSRNFLF